MNRLIPTLDTPPLHASVVEWMAVGVQDYAEKTAIVFGEEMLTYAQLDALSNRVAGLLIKRGVTPGDCVGLCLRRSIEMVAGLLGILKAGAAYVPLDPAYPAERLGMMVEDAKVRCVLAHSAHRPLFADLPGLLVWETIKDSVSEASAEPVLVPVDAESPAYVIFTSGSTGRPKGIEMPHRALANLIEWQLERKTFRPGARVLQYSSISFDVSFQEISTTFASGGTLYLIADEDRRDPRLLLKALVEQRIERLFLPYVAMRSMIETALVLDTFPESLTEIITAGEQLRVDEAVRRFFRRIDGSSLDNQYGPSETHVITAHLLEGDPEKWPELPSIGTALKNCGTCILDEAMQPVADGTQGELYLAGRNLAHGYIHRAELTQQVFVPNPFETPGRPILYKTGDLASYAPDGTIEFMGRRDHQIKVLGHRVEPGEINNTAARFAGIGQCLTHAFKSDDGVTRLAAYYTVQPGQTVAYTDLRKHLDDHLPDYMVPAFLIELKEIPYTPSGKVDLKSLPKPSIENSLYAGEVAHYESETEAGLATIWSKLLGLDAIPRSADFFELGGDSLRAVTLFLEIHKAFGKDLSLSTLSHASTIAALSNIIDGNGGDAPDLSDYRALQLMHQGEEGIPPLFLVHGGRGNVLVFNGFIQMLDPRQPVYAFQWPGWDGRPGPSDIRRMARDYCAELTRFYPEGPIRLGGYCIGGLIAIELVRELEAAGRTIDYPLVVWDSPNIASIHYHRDEPWDSARNVELFEKMKQGLEAIRLDAGVHVELSGSDFKPPTGRAAQIRAIPGLIELLRWGKELKESFGRLPRYREICAIHRTGETIPMDWRAHHCLWSMIKAARKHRSSHFKGDMLYFRSDCVVGRHFGLPGWWDDPFLGFAELCDGSFEAHAIGGDHTDVLDIPVMGEIVNRAFFPSEDE